MGLADVEQGVTVSPLTRFRSTAAAVLHEQGKLDYDAPIQKYVPSFPDKGHKITARMLAGHIGGIRYYADNNSDEFYSAKQYKDVLESLDIFASDPLAYEPGTKYLYTTYGTNLLGAAIQGAAGKPFPVVLQELVFEPLGMRSSSVDEFAAIIPNRTRYYERDNAPPGGYTLRPSSQGDGKTIGRLLNVPFADNSNKWPGGGMITTPDDLVRYGDGHLQPGYLKAETIRMHFTPMKTSDGKSTNYAMNWDVRTDAQGRMTWSKGGSSVGGKSILLMYPDTKVVVAIQHNLTNPNYGQVPAQIAELFMRAASAAAPAR
jgi:CubicO group peptidase (beta-lactamase class C family)